MKLDAGINKKEFEVKIIKNHAIYVKKNKP